MVRGLPRIGKLRMGVVAAWTVALLIAACSGTAPSNSAPQGGSSASPAAVEARLAAAIGQQLGSGQDYTRVRAILVQVAGRTVFERYYRSSPEQYRNVFSVTKSVMSTLVGIAVGEGRLHLNDTLAELLPTYAARMSPDVARTTLRQVLTMTAGFAGEIDAEDNTFTASQDWAGSILQHPTGPPGRWFAYSNGGAHLLSAILVNATKVSVLDYARARLFDPLGIVTRPALEPLYEPENLHLDAYLAADFAWPIDPQRRHTGFSDLKLRPQDMARIGTLYLNGGRRDGQQIVPAAWVRDATTKQVATPPAHPAEGYGYQWWVTTIGGDLPAFFALGFGGQLIEVIPRLDLVVAISSEVNERDPNDRVVDGSLLSFLVRGVIAQTLR